MKKRLEIGVVVLLLMGASLVTRSLIMRSSRPKIDAKVYQKVNSTTASVIDRLEALLVLAKAQDAAGLRAARNWVNTNTDFTQAGGFTALSYYKDSDVLAEVKVVWPTLNEQVRMNALDAFAARPTEARIKWFQELTKSPDMAIQTLSQTILLTLEKDPAKIQNGLKGIFEDFNGINSVEQGRMIELIGNKFGAQPTTQKWLLTLIDKNRAAHVQVTAIRKLMSTNINGLDGHIQQFVQNETPEVRAAAIEAIPQLCPEGYWRILQQEASAEPSMFVLRRVVDVLSNLKGQDAQRVLKTVKARDGKLSKDVFAQVAVTEKSLTAQPQTNVCASRSKTN